MKRNFLLLTMAAAGLWLLGSTPASAIAAGCPAGTQGTQLAAGQWAVKIEGFVTDTAACGTSCPDPTPQAENCFGVITSDGTCDITGGDLLCSNPTSGITGPATVSGLKVFSGTSSPANDVGSYFFNSNNTGQIAIVDAPSGKTYAFGLIAGLGNTTIQGASIFTTPGTTVSDPLIITIEKRDQTITAAQFLAQNNIAFDPAGGSAGGSGLGRGFDAVAVGAEEHLDPETGTTPEGGGTIFFNIDGGYDSDLVPGVQLFPSLIADFHETVLAQNTGDGTQLASATLNGDYMFPLPGASFQTASVLWGATNTNVWTATVGSAGAPSAGLAIASGGRSVLVGSDSGQAALLITSPSNLHPSKTVTITNGSIEPLDWTGISIQGVPDVTITSSGPGTCNAAGGDLAAWNPVGSIPKPTCTITFTDSGTPCTTGSPEIGTYRLNAADHAMVSGTATAAGITFSLKCQ